MRSIIAIFVLLLLCSCGNKTTEEVASAIDIAQSYLSKEKCNEAIEILEDVGRQNDDAVYLQVLASAYACRAGYSTIRFISTDVDTIDSSATGLLSSLATMSLSDETTTDSDAYEDMRTALEVLLYADGGDQPSQAARTAKYGVRKAGDMGMQALLLSIVQLGKFINHFGNVDANGDKGASTDGSNTCFIDYTYGPAQTVVGGLTVCSGNNDGHPDLNTSTAEGRRRICEGLVLMTNVLDVLENITVSEETLSVLNDVKTTAVSIRDTAVGQDPALGTLLGTTSQSVCESELASSAELDNMQYIYALVFEAGLE